MSLFDLELVRRIREMRRTKSIRCFLDDQPLETRSKDFLRKKTSQKLFFALFGIVMIFLVHPAHAGKILEVRATPVVIRQILTTSLPASTPQPTTIPPSGRPVRFTSGLVVLFVVGLLIALAMAGIGLGLGLWMKRRDKS
jgi:hypothetical protein